MVLYRGWYTRKGDMKGGGGKERLGQGKEYMKGGRVVYRGLDKERIWIKEKGK